MVHSFDIFDTLLLRPYTDPQEVWRVLEEQEGAKGFAKARKKADATTYANLTEDHPETSIEEAYSIMPKRFHDMMQKEMDLERRVLQANPEMLALWNELGLKGEKRIIISDMYMPASFIMSVLQEKGFSGWDGFYLSSERNARKATGKLFEIMLKEQKVKPSEVLHIGDNKWSDVKIPKEMGIQVKYFKKVCDRLFEDFPFMRHINGRLAGALAIGWHQYKQDHPDYNYWNKIGFSMGGVLGYMYIKWIADTSKKIGFNHLMFVGRDGYILEKICNKLYPSIKTDYFFAPRLTSIAVLGATGNDPVAIADRQRYMDEHLKGVDTEEIKRNYTQYLQQYNIDDKTAIVDGCSSGFSAQRLVEAAINHNTFCFYLLAMAELTTGGALYSTQRKSLPFQDFSEFLFGAPTPPVVAITDEGIIFANNISDNEKFKMSVSDDILQGTLSCISYLNNEMISITPDDWMNYFNLFMREMTEHDKLNLSSAKNATDVEQKTFSSIIRDAFPHKCVRLILWGHEVLTSYYSYKNSCFVREHYIAKRLLLKRIIGKQLFKQKVVAK